MKIAVNIVSDHTIPNVLFIKEFSLSVESYVFISTQKMKDSQKVQNITKASGIDQNQVQEIIVDEYDFLSTMNSLEKYVNSTDEYVVNITCGTKLMSLATYQVFQSRKAVVYYHGIATETFIPIFSYLQQYEPKPIHSDINLEEFLTAYGLSYSAKQPEYNFEKSVWMKNHFLEYEDSIAVLRKVRNDCTNVRNRLHKKRTIDLLNSAYESYMNEHNIIISEQMKQGALQLSRLLGFDPEQMTKSYIEYIIGGWFEEYIYYLVKKHLELRNDFCAIGVNIQKEGDEVSSKGNELDVVFLKGTELHIIECKSSIDKQLLLNTLYKQAALRKDFGMRIKSAVATMSMEDRKNKWKNEKDRAEYLGVRLFDGTNFDDDNRIQEFIEQLK